MATVYLKLSKRVQKDTGMSEVIIRLRNNNDYDILAKSGIFITADNFRNGEIKVNTRKVGNDTKYHEEQASKMFELKKTILEKVNAERKEAICKEWLNTIIDQFNHPEAYINKVEHMDFIDLTEEYLTSRQISATHTKTVRAIARIVERYEAFVRATDNKDFSFDINTLTKHDIEDFIDYLRNEHALQEEYPDLFKRLVTINPNGKRKCHNEIEVRGENTITKISKQIKSIFNWCYEKDKTKNRPFDGIKLGSPVFGTPYYISIEERNKIADFDLSENKHLEAQRDIFIFQCFVGCRVSDLIKLTSANIHNGILSYTPHKTKDDGSQSVQARVPLHPKAVALIDKYKGIDEAGRLFPFIAPQKYNDAIKDVFTLIGITRKVEIRNAKTGEPEMIPINEIASSHMARRTFIGNAYLKVSDPNLIGKMSGHVEGSRAFTRYRKIEDSTLEAIIKQLG
jgi:integrase